mmetsp:Transcript_538/g.764  ORF Transcript_538/g.764 Transcript_538/m.764 type:complete len:205 (+) Transcript_538:182-796(+)
MNGMRNAMLAAETSSVRISISGLTFLICWKMNTVSASYMYSWGPTPPSPAPGPPREQMITCRAPRTFTRSSSSVFRADPSMKYTLGNIAISSQYLGRGAESDIMTTGEMRFRWRRRRGAIMLKSSCTWPTITTCPENPTRCTVASDSERGDREWKFTWNFDTCSKTLSSLNPLGLTSGSSMSTRASSHNCFPVRAGESSYSCCL